MILLIDNYDSFTYNLYQFVGELGETVKVYRNDKITVKQIEKLKPSHIIISPGPGRPENAGRTCEIIKYFSGKIPILGVCLGMQAIGHVFGCDIIQLNEIMHGKVSKIFHKETNIFRGLNNPFTAGRYHSLGVDPASVPDEIEVTAKTDNGVIMGIAHKKYKDVIGIQFHPESVLTPDGKKILFNFLYKKNRREKESMLKTYINKVIDNKDLTSEEAVKSMDIIMSGNATPAQIAAFLTALRLKKETIEEIAGFASVMREKATRIKVNRKPLLDTCGTGGDKSGTFNISTTAALVAAAAGAVVVKHGNRSVSSNCGSADLLNAMGVNINIPPEAVEACIEEVGIGFLFAPLLHSAMKHAIGPRREIAIRTVFNILGPMTNPAGAENQLLGVYDEDLTETVASVLQKLGSKNVFVVHGTDGLDEITLTGKTKITELNNDELKTYFFNPEDYGFSLCIDEDLKGGTAADNLKITKEILSGKNSSRKDVTIINAGFGLLAAGLAESHEKAFLKAEEAINSGAAEATANKLVEFTSSIKTG